MLIGFLHEGGIKFWMYALAADTLIQGSSFVSFTSKDINYDNRTIDGEIWLKGEWIKKRTRFPDAIRNFELKRNNKQNAMRILDVIPYSLGPTVSKFEQTELFTRVPSLAKYVPETLKVAKGIDIIEKISQWGAGLLKPIYGRLGQGIIFIKANGTKFDIEIAGKLQTITKKELQEIMEPYYDTEARPYILQQFAAGTAPNGRYFNVRIVVIKSGDGDWHPCNIPMSLLAPKGSIIANRDVGAKNIDLVSLLKKKFALKSNEILDELFEASVKITRVLDDSVNNTAEEIALDLAIDDKGKSWLHEANWRGGIWLFEDDIGLHRHGGSNIKRIALQNRAGVNIDTSNAIDIIIKRRKQYLPKSFFSNAAEKNIILGLKISRRSDETVSLIALAICNYLPILSISSQTSFRLAQKLVGEAINVVKEQLPLVQMPKIISLGGACVHNPNEHYESYKWLLEKYVKTDLITIEDLTNGFSLSPLFLRRIIKDNCEDLNLNSLDIFIIEGLEKSLLHKPNYEQIWEMAATEIDEAIYEKRVREWGFCLNETTILSNQLSTDKLLEILSQNEIGLPSTLYIKIESFEITNITKVMKILSTISLKLIFSLPEAPLKKKEWNEQHPCVPIKLIKKYIQRVLPNSVVLSPIEKLNDLKEILNANFDNSSQISWHYMNDKKEGKNMPMLKNEKQKLIQKEKKREQRSLEALSKFARFDTRQYFRFFVDGRFHNSYRGWVGYEENEPGSAVGILNAYSYFLDHFDLSNGLKPSYIRNLHFLCMNNVGTKNLKSTPGELRFLEAGFNIYKKYSTVDSVSEILEIRSGDGTPVFHTAGFEKEADALDATKVMEALQEKNRLKFRPWYPPLSPQQKKSLTQEGNLDTYYDTKHYIQRGFAKRLDDIILDYNNEISKAKTDDDTFMAISRVTRNIEMLHPFPDGNGRLCIAILMNHLLLYHGFLPAILFDPNIDIELSVKEFAQEIRDGIKNTEILLADPEASIYDFSITNLTDQENKTFKEMSKEFILKLSPYADLNAPADQTKENKHSNIYCYLTPERLLHISKGSWVNVKSDKVSNIRFQHIGIEASIDKPQQLMFFRQLKELKEKHIDPIAYIQEHFKDNVTAMVVDDMDLAKQLSIPTLYVDNVDDVLYRAANTVRKTIHAKAIAIAGTQATTFAKTMLYNILMKQAGVHAQFNNDNKTPAIMSSLINLKLTDNIEIIEVDVGTRPNPVRYRSRAIMPNICFFSSLDSDQKKGDRLDSIIDAYSAMAEGLQDGGVCLINSNFKYTTELIDAIKKRKDVSVQTFGTSEDDIAYVIKATLDNKNKKWDIEANVLGELLHYKVSGTDDYIPVVSTGILLAVSTLGYDIYDAAMSFEI